MARERVLAAADASAALTHSFVTSAVLSDYWRLTKPEVTFLVAVTTAAGFYLGWSRRRPTSMDPVPAHAARHRPRRERRGGSQSVDGARSTP